jgi:hypothetical protein
MALYVAPFKPSGEAVVGRAEYDARVVAYAIVAGIILYFLKKSFINNFPYYASIIIGLLLAIYLNNYGALKYLGIALMADGFYKLITEHVTLSS